MPIPANQVTHAELVMAGVVAAAGSTAKNAQFVFHYRRTATILPIVKAQVEAAFQAAVAIPITNAVNIRYAQVWTSVRWVNDAQDVPVQVTRLIAGAVAGDSMPTSSAAFLLLKTGLRGRSYRGSKHFFPLSETDTTIGTADLFNAAALVLWGIVATNILAGFTDAGGNVWVPAVLSRKLSTLKTNPTVLVVNDVATVSINKRIGGMNRRKVRSVY